MKIFLENIVPLDKIKQKLIKDITFKETISLIYHAAQKLIDNQDYEDGQKWKDLFNEFHSELVEQDKRSWPKLIIIKNDYSMRIDIFYTGQSYISSNNFLMQLFRLLYVENYKRTYIYKSFNYHNILGHKLSNQSNNSNLPIQKISLEELFILLKEQLKYYLKIYNDNDNFEHALANELLEQI